MVLVGFLQAFPAVAAEKRSITLVENADYFGFDLRAEKDVSLERCEEICIADRQCRAFTYNTAAQWCFLKSDFDRLEPFAGAVAGKIVSKSAEPDIGAPPRLSFLWQGFRGDAAVLRDNILNQSTSQGAQVGMRRVVIAAMDASASGQYYRAMDFYKIAIGIEPNNQDNWLGYSTAVLDALRGASTDNNALRQEASSAAYNAYQDSRTVGTRARALANLARALEYRGHYRPALEAFKKSLALAEDADVLARYRDLNIRQGFRVLDHTVDASGATARVCMRFTEELLQSGVDYASYVSIGEGTPGSVRAEGSQICVAGLNHGQAYELTVRAGLPSKVGDALLAPITIKAYIRDRAPSVRFSGDAFVLPGTGRKGVPVVSVNAEAIDVELYRVGSRSLTQLLSRSQFLTQLDGYDAATIREDLGELVWKGVLEVASDTNREMITSFPIDTAIPQREPGIYIVMAKVSGEKLDRWSSRATQWLVVSDIGLSTLTGNDGLHVFARSLDTALPIGGVNLKLLARNNEVLGEAVTDENGQARFVAGLVRGKEGLAPAVITASGSNADFVFLDLTRAGFDLSDRGVTGRPAPGPLDLYAWTDRGIYRAGETIHLAATMRDDEANAVADLPLTFIVTRPDGKEDRRVVRTGGTVGGYALDLTLPDNAMQGSWTIRSYGDVNGPALSETTYLVEDFRPDRIEFSLGLPQSMLVSGTPGVATVDGRFLYGAPAAGLAVEAELKLKSVRQRSGFSGFVFGLTDEDPISNQVNISQAPALDQYGKANINIGFDELPATTLPLEAELTVRVREGGGRAVERVATMPVQPDSTMIGIRPLFEDQQVEENTPAQFQIIAIDADGQRVSADGLNWSLVRLERDYQWYSEGNSWRYEAVEYTRQEDAGSIDIALDEPTAISLPVDWGRYRLEVESADPSGPATGIEFSAGWFVTAGSTESPDGLEIALDKMRYNVGDVARLQISPRFAGQALITVSNDQLYQTMTTAVSEDGTIVDIPIKKEWGAGAYVTATLIRPGQAVQSRLPTRAIGIQWLTINPQNRALDVVLDVPEKIEPNSRLTVPVSVQGAGVAREARVTIAAVDVGILNLTAFTPPDPEAWYFGQHRLGLEMRDLYGRLIDGSQGVTGRIRSGGDGPGATIKGSPPKEKLVSLYSGIIMLDDRGKADIDFDIPQFNGTLKLMAVAWTAEGVGQASNDVIVRDPLVVTASLPKFLAPDDVSKMRFDLVNADGPAGEYTIELETGPSIFVNNADLPQKVILDEGQATVLSVDIEAGKPGQNDITLRLLGPDGRTLENIQQLEVRPSTLPVTTTFELPLSANGGRAVIDQELLAGSYLNGASISVGISRGGIDVPGLLMSLDRYPYGCAEQTTSRALPLLYLSEMDAPTALLEDRELRARVEDAISRLLSYQSAQGSFGLWGVGGDNLWLNAYVTDFLTRAREKDYAVPQIAMRIALQNLQNVMAYNNNVEENGDAIAYALYVLARNKQASAGDLRYYADVQLDAFRTPAARAQIAAALALYGDAERAERVFGSAFRLASSQNGRGGGGLDFGSSLRDDATMLALAGESRPVTPLLGGMVSLVAQSQLSSPARTTQEQAWMLLAARALQDADDTQSLLINDLPADGLSVEGQQIIDRPIRLENTGDSEIVATVTRVASPIDPPRAGANGFKIKRVYYDLEGREINIESVRQNERFVVVLTVEQTNSLDAQILVTDLLPAGLEIDNARLVASANVANFNWLSETTPAHTQFRDDRFVAAFDVSEGREDPIRVAYVVRAVVPGVYAHPAAQVEDMYRPQYFARTASGWLEVAAAQ